MEAHVFVRIEYGMWSSKAKDRRVEHVLGKPVRILQAVGVVDDTLRCRLPITKATSGSDSVNSI